MAIHYLKTWPKFFKEVHEGKKPFELRRNDRDFREGDYVVLQEWNNEAKVEREADRYTGREIRGSITFVLKAEDCPWVPLHREYVVLGMRWTDGLASANRGGCAP